MPLYRFKEHEPQLGTECYLAPSADVIGKVYLKEHVSVWFQTVIRGDDDEIIVGKNTNIQDLCMLHVIHGGPLLIGENVSIGHKVTLHACTIGDGCLIGMGATVLDGAVIGKNSVVAAGSVVPPGKIYPEGSMIMGAPATVKRSLTEDEIELYSNHYKNYLITKSDYLSKTNFEKL